MYRKSIASVLVLVVVTVVLSGCIAYQTATTMNPDGSGINDVRIGFSKEVLAMMQEEGNGDDPFTTIREEFAENPEGWQTTVSAWEDDTYTGVTAALHYTNPAMLEAQLNTLLGPDLDHNRVSQPPILFEPFVVQQEGNAIRITTGLKPSETTDDSEVPTAIYEGASVVWSVALPTLESYTEQEIATREGNRVTWHIPLVRERDYVLEVRGTLASDGNTVATPVPSSVVQPAALLGELCFAEVDNCITGRIRQYWEQNGGLPVFGFPITPQHEETIEGVPLQVQWFERNRLELHPENAPPYDVLLGRVGVQVLEQSNRDWHTFPKSNPQDAQTGCLFFAETEQSVCGDILQVWQSHGLEQDGKPGFSQAESLALFGVPISGRIEETLGDGATYTVQYFERARFELHPENTPPHHVLFGLLGNEAGH
jgi:hypothetical protein